MNYPKRKVLAGEAKRRKREGSDDEFWGTHNLSEGCSGPSGNEGATSERWYQKKVLVLWRDDHSLAVRCKSSLSGGVGYVLNILENGHIENGEKGFRYLWVKVEEIKLYRKSMIKMLRMCHILKLKEESETLLEMFGEFGIFSESAAKIIADTFQLYSDDSHKNIIKDIIKNTQETDVPILLRFCENITWIEPKELLQVIVNNILKGTPKTNDYYGECWEYYFLSMAIDSKDVTPHTTAVLLYMYENNVFPDAELNGLITKIGTLSNLESAVTLSIQKQDVKVVNLLLMRFVELASQYIEMVNREGKFYRVPKEVSSMDMIFKSLVGGVKKFQQLSESVFTLVSIIKLSKNHQDLIKPFLKILEIYSENKETIPECLQEAFLVRIEFLEETVSKGEPKMNWHQPNAFVPRHPDVEAFLKGPQKQMVFGHGTFRNITAAKQWASDHAKDKGCYMTLTPSGVGKKAVVTIVKTVEGFDEQIAAYRDIVNEYRRLLKFVPKHQSVIPSKSSQQSSTEISTGKESEPNTNKEQSLSGNQQAHSDMHPRRLFTQTCTTSKHH